MSPKLTQRQLECTPLSTFKSLLKTHLCTLAFPPTPNASYPDLKLVPFLVPLPFPLSHVSFTAVLFII